MREKVKNVHISANSSLIIADDCILENVEIDGHSEIRDTNGKPVKVENK